jgi:hypothetical protein
LLDVLGVEPGGAGDGQPDAVRYQWVHLCECLERVAIARMLDEPGTRAGPSVRPAALGDDLDIVDRQCSDQQEFGKCPVVEDADA